VLISPRFSKAYAEKKGATAIDYNKEILRWVVTDDVNAQSKLAQKRAASPEKRCVILTHNQPFSAYDMIEENLERRLRPIRSLGQIDVWADAQGSNIGRERDLHQGSCCRRPNGWIAHFFEQRELPRFETVLHCTWSRECWVWA
jgi:hypothetical protein